ncbi:MAG: glycosyltransferase, partial [Actinobacteria bacterium]|nr:glycosyltransferase [Actinomycetota bacterium]
AKAAGGEYMAFLNNDTKVDREWLIELLKPVYGSADVVASGSKVLSMDGQSLDFVGGMINFEGKGFQIDYGVGVKEDKHDYYKYLPFVNGGAMLIKRDIFLEAGGFDEDFFAYYEDVDLGWRLWVLGYKVVFAPGSIVYHHHHGTSKIFSEDKLRFLKERNSLYSVFKNYDEDNLARLFSGTLLNIFNRVFVDFDFDYKSYYDLSGTSGVEEKEPEIPPVTKEPLSSIMAVRNFLDEMPGLLEKRRRIQGRRRRDDKTLFSYFKGQFLSVTGDQQYQENQIGILSGLGIYDVFKKDINRKLLIISSEIVTQQMAGPAIRVWNFARVLSQHMDVTLAVPNKLDMPEQDFEIVSFSNNIELREIIKKAAIILCGGMTFAKYRSIKDSGKYLIIDIYDPYNLATLVEYENEPIKKRMDIHRSIYGIFNEQFYYGDFFICASERQRDFWLGMLSALNRVNPYAYDQDPTLRKTIDVVPFGLPENRPIHTGEVLKGRINGIEKDDFVIIWGGGIYNWFDPLALIRAMDLVVKERSDIKLFFMGVKHPNPEVRELRLVNESVSLAKKLGLFDKNIFFNFGWIDYNSRQDYLLESDVGIITYPEHIETRFSFRTRILDYFWTGLPIISTAGDSLSDMIEKKGLGIIVKNGSVDGIAGAILRMARDREFYQGCKSNIEKIAGDFTWEKVCQPVLAFCRDPYPSAYRQREKDPEEIEDSGSGIGPVIRKGEPSSGGGYLMRRFFYHLFHSGPGKTAGFVSNYLKKQ